MSDDYLWDRSGPVDPEVERLEQMLQPLGYAETRRREAHRPTSSVRTRWTPRLLALAAAVTLTVAAGVWWRVGAGRPQTPSWTVGRLEGAPVIGSRAIGDRGELRVGSALETDAAARARIKVADIGIVDVEPGSRVELLRAAGDQYRLRLARGTVHARITAPPRRFVMETPSSTAVDLGCEYTLQVDEGGAGQVQVTFGWVAFEWQGRESFVPAGAMCQTRPRFGPGTPYYTDVSAEFRAALDELDFGDGDPRRRAAALDRVLLETRAQDGLTLWHLLERGNREERSRLFDRLAALLQLPTDIERDAVVAGDRETMDRLWSALGLGDLLSVRVRPRPPEGPAR